MSGSVALQPEPAPIVACTISRDVQNFDLLIEDMEAELGETWGGDLALEDAITFFGQPDADALEFVAIAMDDEDEGGNLALVADIIKHATGKGIKVIVIAEEVSPPIALHQLLKMGGAEEFVPPYPPLPEGALRDAIERLRAPEPEPAQAQVPEGLETTLKPTGDREGVVLPVHGMAGGTGSTTLAVNLAWELATIEKDNPPRVCLLDLDLQFGSISTFLDLPPRREAVYEMLSDTEMLDHDSFMQAMLTYNDRLQVLTAPADMLPPLDLVSAEDIDRVINFARTNFDYVVIDMPSTVVQWTETVLQHAHVYFATMELDMRCAQNTLRMIRALKSEELPFSKLRYVLNRAPKFTDLTGKARVKRLAESWISRSSCNCPMAASRLCRPATTVCPPWQTRPPRTRCARKFRSSPPRYMS